MRPSTIAAAAFAAGLAAFATPAFAVYSCPASHTLPDKRLAQAITVLDEQGQFSRGMLQWNSRQADRDSSTFNLSLTYGKDPAARPVLSRIQLFAAAPYPPGTGPVKASLRLKLDDGKAIDIDWPEYAQGRSADRTSYRGFITLAKDNAAYAPLYAGLMDPAVKGASVEILDGDRKVIASSRIDLTGGVARDDLTAQSLSEARAKALDYKTLCVHTPNLK